MVKIIIDPIPKLRFINFTEMIQSWIDKTRARWRKTKSEDPSSRNDRMRGSWSLGRSLRTVKREFWLQFGPVANDRRPSVRMSLMKKAIGGSIHRIREFELEKVTRLENRIFLVIPSFFPPYSFAALFHRFPIPFDGSAGLIWFFDRFDRLELLIQSERDE